LEARAIVSQGNEQALKLLNEAEDKARVLTLESEEATTKRRRELDREDERLRARREELDKRIEKLEQREQNLNKRQSRLDKQQNDLEKAEAEKLEQLQQIAQMTVDEARRDLIAQVERDARQDMARTIRQVEAEARAGRSRSAGRSGQPRPRCDRAGGAALGLRTRQ